MDKLKESLQAKRFLKVDEISLERLMDFNKRRYTKLQKIVNESCEYLKKYDDKIESTIIPCGDYNSNNSEFEINFNSKGKHYNNHRSIAFSTCMKKEYLTVYFSSKEIMKYQKEVLRNYKNYLEEMKNVIDENSLRESALIWVPDKTNQLFIETLLDKTIVAYLPEEKRKTVEPYDIYESELLMFSNEKEEQTKNSKIHRVLHQCSIDDNAFEMYTLGIENFFKSKKLFSDKSIKENDLSLLNGIIIDRTQLSPGMQKQLRKDDLRIIESCKTQIIE